MQEMPKNFELYKSTPVFTEETIPSAILNRHNTKKGTWGKLNILEGEAIFVDLENEQEIVATPDRPVNIVEEAWHHVKVSGPVKLRVDFYREKEA
ncbi:MAG: DUF1971 domain-containing protein [Lentisphaeraceae bacterium]|nr:DUF1971 domain-containing protein [Lentisphaeraceae bacterium]